MLTVDNFAQIREARRDGLTIRAIARRYGHSTKTVLKALADPQPKPYTLAKPRPARVFDAVRSIVDDILTQDRTAPPKHRHTASQIFRRWAASLLKQDKARGSIKAKRLNAALDHKYLKRVLQGFKAI